MELGSNNFDVHIEMGVASAGGGAGAVTGHHLEWFFLDDVKSSRGEGTNVSIPRVPPRLKGRAKLSLSFRPDVVSLGPYHHDDPRLQSMEGYKRTAAKQFTDATTPATRRNAEPFYEAVKGVVDEARASYQHIPAMNDDKFTQIMFVDGCFLLHFVRHVLGKDEPNDNLWFNFRQSVVRDIMLLENQIPYVILKVLMDEKQRAMTNKGVGATTRRKGIAEKFVKMASSNVNYQSRRAHLQLIDRFIDKQLLKSLASHLPNPIRLTTVADAAAEEGDEEEPAHILDGLRTKLLGLGKKEKRSERRTPKDDWYPFHSVIELKAAGIRFGRSGTGNLTDVSFDDHLFWGKLFLPPFVVDDTTKDKFLNLIAYELSGRGPDTEYGVISYVWLMDSLVNTEKDVEVLEAEGILFNSLGSNMKVVELFKVLDMDLAPRSNPRAYADVKRGIEKHCKSRWRVSVGRSLYSLSENYFNSPWAAISVVTALYLLFISTIQTYYTVYPSPK